MRAPSPSRINIRDIDKNLHAAFKAECARRGRTMKGMVVAFMRASLQKNIHNRPIIDVGRLSRHYHSPR